MVSMMSPTAIKIHCHYKLETESNLCESLTIKHQSLLMVCITIDTKLTFEWLQNE